MVRGNAFISANHCRLSVRNYSTAENPPALQIINGRVDLLKCVSMGHQVIQLELALAVPPNEQREVALRTTVSPARAGEGTITDEQAGIQFRLRSRRWNADEQGGPAPVKTWKSGPHSS